MSLHGTLETFALPDVLALLAATKKSGELRVVGGKTDGRVWFDAGAVVGAEVGRAVTFVDAAFELLRLESGKFSFDADKAAPTPGEPAAIEPLLAEAQARLAEWKSIEAVIPSLEHGVALVPEVGDPHVMVTGEQWRALVNVAAAPSVNGVVERLGVGEFETCRTLKGLVEAGLMTVVERAQPAPAPVPAPAPAPEAKEADKAPATDTDEAAATAPPTTAAPAPAVAVPARLGPTPSPDKPKIQALTSSPAASAAELEEAQASTPAPSAGEADELVRQVAAMEATAPEPAASETTPPEPAAAEPTPAEAVEAVEPVEAPAPEPTPTAEGEEPINRGLLLKFLSSVRT